MSDTSERGPVFAAIGVVTVGDRQLGAEPIDFDMSGVHMILRKVSGTDGFEVITTGRNEPGIARFEKTCIEPVSFYVRRNGRRYWRVDIPGMFDAMRLELSADPNLDPAEAEGPGSDR